MWILSCKTRKLNILKCFTLKVIKVLSAKMSSWTQISLLKASLRTNMSSLLQRAKMISKCKLKSYL